jgi:hypothetical protein
VEPDATDAFHLRLFVGGLTTPDVLIRHVTAFRERNAERLETLRSIEPTNTRTGHDAFHWYLLQLGIAQHELQQRWADETLADLREKASA